MSTRNENDTDTEFDNFEDDDLFAESGNDSNSFQDEFDENLIKHESEIDRINEKANKSFTETTMGRVSIGLVAFLVIGSLGYGYLNDTKQSKRTAKTKNIATPELVKIKDDKVKTMPRSESNKDAAAKYELVSTDSANSGIIKRTPPIKSLDESEAIAETPDFQADKIEIVTEIEKPIVTTNNFVVEELQAKILTKDSLISKKDKTIELLQKKLSEASKKQSTINSAQNIRLAGFKIITSSKDSKYAIVKSPTKTITLFKGETFYSHLGKHSVSKYDPRKQILTLDNKYFIDTVLEKRPISKRSKKKSAISSVNTKVVKKDTTLSNSTAFEKKTITEYTILSFSAEKKVAVVKNKHNLITRIEVGSVFKGFGRMLNITQNGDLIFNDYIIRFNN